MLLFTCSAKLEVPNLPRKAARISGACQPVGSLINGVK